MSWKKLSKVALMVVTVCFCTFSYAEIVWIDVRTKVEHKIDNIEGDILIAYGEIVEKVSELYPDKNTEISLYCRSGNRAGKALTALEGAGYTNVSNVGSIGDARKQRSINN